MMMAILHTLQATLAPKRDKIDVQPFDGSDYSLYPQFESALQAKFAIETVSFASEAAMVWWALGKLKDKAARVMNPWTEAYKADPTGFTVQNMFAQMKVQFGDTERRKKALQQLQHLRQSNRPFEELLADFNRLLLEAGGHGWDDALKIGMLRAALNLGMKDRMVAVVEAEDYNTYCQQVKGIADKLESLQKIKRFSRYPHGPRPTVRAEQQASPSASQPANDTMEWEPTHTRLQDKGKRRRAKWVSQEEMDRRRKERRCLRCGATGHEVRTCVYLPAKRPDTPPKVSAVAPMLEDDEPMDATYDNSDSSGKE
jgi:hypothetical protein